MKQIQLTFMLTPTPDSMLRVCDLISITLAHIEQQVKLDELPTIVAMRDTYGKLVGAATISERDMAETKPE